MRVAVTKAPNAAEAAPRGRAADLVALEGVVGAVALDFWGGREGGKVTIGAFAVVGGSTGAVVGAAPDAAPIGTEEGYMEGSKEGKSLVVAIIKAGPVDELDGIAGRAADGEDGGTPITAGEAEDGAVPGVTGAVVELGEAAVGALGEAAFGALDRTPVDGEDTGEAEREGATTDAGDKKEGTVGADAGAVELVVLPGTVAVGVGTVAADGALGTVTTIGTLGAMSVGVAIVDGAATGACVETATGAVGGVATGPAAFVHPHAAFNKEFPLMIAQLAGEICRSTCPYSTICEHVAEEMA